MMMRGWQRVLSLLAALLVVVPEVAAQERVTLEEAVARGLQHSALIAELQAREAGSIAAEQGRKAAGLPVVAASAGYTRTNHVQEFFLVNPPLPRVLIYPDVPDNFRARIDLQWPIYTGGRLDALERAARAERGAAGEEIETARAELRLEITRAFWALVTARESEQVLDRSVKNLDAHVSDLRVRLEQGLIPPNDLLTAEAQRSHRRGLLIEASNLRAIAEADLRRLIGGASAAPIEPVPPPAPSSVAAADAAPRPERRTLEYRLAAAQERETAVSALFKPQLSANAGYDYARPNPRTFPRTDQWDDSWDVSINASWTLWDGGRRAAERAEAAAAAQAIASRVVEFDRTAAFEIQARRLELDSAQAAIAAAVDGIRAAEEARRVVNERYRAGVATSTDVLDAELAALQAELDRTRAVASSRLAEARLTRALGLRTP